MANSTPPPRWQQQQQQPKPSKHTSATLFSLPSSAASSRNSSPASSLRQNYGAREYDLQTIRQAAFDGLAEEEEEERNLDGLQLGKPPGRLLVPVDVYGAMLPRWRAVIREKLLKRVERESKVIARMQEYIRTPFLDAYFVYTSSLGTHTFFMTAIPALYFFGYDDLGGGLVLILAFGVYLTSVIKDLICSPRPFSPPVTRLTIGTHHLEYGFPSTHSTNSISIALFLFAIIYQSTYPSTADEPALSPQTFAYSTLLLCVYAFSIVFGRLYTAMHCFTDCAMGVSLGAAIWWAETSWTGIPIQLYLPSSLLHPTYLLIRTLQFFNIGSPSPSSDLTIQLGHGLGLGSSLCTWVENGGWEVPLILIPLCLLAVNQHPQPVDDCPCFEDAIAFGSVVLGVLVGKWATSYFGISRHSVIMPGSGWSFAPETGWAQVPRGWNDVLIWWSMAVLKMAFGVFAIFAWRLLAKSALHLILPPTYRLLSRAFKLPKRRFYTPATEYKTVPSEFSKDGGVLHTIPSVIDLPSTNRSGGGVDDACNGTGVKVTERGRDVKMRLPGPGVMDKELEFKKVNEVGHVPEEREDKEGEPIKHYDAEVMTKLVVYSGIAVLASQVLPAFYNYLGWGVRSWPA